MFPDRWRQIEEIFLDAAELPKTERDAFVAEACGGDRELEDQVRKLLASDESASGFIDSPIWTDSKFLNTSAKNELSHSLDRTAGSERDNFLGHRIGPFKLVREIGRGGMGAVYLGERVDGEFDQRVAVKLIKRGMDSDFIVRRFRHERQILAALEHPFIARLLDGGTTEDGVPYFIMEHVEGETLYNFCDSKRLGFRDRLKIFQKLCSALHYAHEKQIIHRDIKPSNVLIDRSGTPKLLDFGIAKILDPDLIHESVNPTASMLRMMTPDYASPEQVQGGEVTPVSDVYSLGVLLYELLTGHKPYNFQGRALHKVADVVCEIMPELPSKILDDVDQLLQRYSGDPNLAYEKRGTTLRELRHALAGGVDDIVMKALAKEPTGRYHSVSAFSEDISRYLHGAPVAAPRYSPVLHHSSAQSLRSSETSKGLAVLPFRFINLGAKGSSDEEFLGFGLADALITRLSKVRRFVVRPTSSIQGFGDGVIDPIRAGKDLNVDYVIDGNIKKAGDRLRVTIQLLDVAENSAIWATSIDETLTDVLTLEDTLSNKVIEVLLPQLAGNELKQFAKRGTDVPEAFEHYLRGRYHFNSFTEEGLAKAFVSFHSAIAADPKYALAYAGIADYYNWLGIIGVLPPQECFLPAIDAAEKAIELDPELSDPHASLGFGLHAGNYDWAGGERHLMKALELNPANANAYVWYSIVLFTQGRFDEGLQFAKRAVELDPLTPFNHHNVGWGLYYARRFGDAIEQYRRVVSEFPSYPFGFYGLSKIHRLSGDTVAAIEENAVARRLMGDSIFTMLSDAEAYAADGQSEGALERIKELEELSSHRYVSPYQMSLVFCYLAKTADNDDPSVAAGYMDRAFELLDAAFESKDAWLNWAGVEPAFDVIRGDERFDQLLEKVGYRMFFKNFSVSNAGIGDVSSTPAPRIHERTTLVIDETHVTDGGIHVTGADRRGNRRIAYAGIAILLLLVSGYFGLTYIREAPSSAVRNVGAPGPSLIVLPFATEADGDAHIGAGLADALTNTLGVVRSVNVLSSGTGRMMAGADPRRIGSELNVSHIVRGRFVRNSEKLTLDAELIDSSTASAVWRDSFTAERGDIFALQNQIAEKVISSLGIEPLPLEKMQLERRYTDDLRAYELYLVGRIQMTRRSAGDLRQAIGTFASALARDPNFAPAYVGLADAYSLLKLYDVDAPEDAYKLARQYAEQAMAIDDNLADAHATVAYIKFYADRDLAGAELDFRRAMQLNPSSAQAHHWFAIFFASTGKFVDAKQEIENAKRLDPRSPSVFAASGMVHFYASEYEAALRECDRALSLDAHFLPALKVKRWVYAATGDEVSAGSIFAEELNSAGGSLEDAGWKVIAAQAGRLADGAGEALALLDAAVRSPEIASRPYAFAYEIALAYKTLGQDALAIEYLEKAVAARSHGLVFLEVDPRFADLRQDDRYKRIIDRARNGV